MNWSERLVKLAVWITPSARGDWAKAIGAELSYLPAPRRLSFAVGGLIAAIGWRVSDAPTLVLATRTVLILGSMLWAALLGRLALILTDVDLIFASGIGLLSLAFAAGAILMIRRGLAAAIQAGTPVMAIAAVYAMFGDRLMPEYQYLKYCRALSVEIAAILFVGLALAASALRYSRRA